MNTLDDRLATAIRHMRYAGYVDVASMVVLIFDYVITFHDETSLVWPSPWSFAKAIFFLTRYLPFIDTSIVVWQLTTPNMSPEDCAFAYESSFWLLGLGICAAEVILSVRTWAVYNFSWRIAALLLVSACFAFIPMLALSAISVHSLQFAPLPFSLPGCLIIRGKSYVLYGWTLLAVFEALMLLLMLVKAVRIYKVQGHTYIYKKVYADGSLFYVYLFALSVANLVIVFKHPLGLANILSSIERVIHSVLTGRILMDLRRLGSHGWEDKFGDDTLDDHIELSLASEGNASVVFSAQQIYDTGDGIAIIT